MYNIVRAAAAEPLSFVGLTGLDGHITLMAGIGLPTINIGPDKSPTQHVFSFGPNSIGGSEASDFHVSVISDPQSFAALLRPTDPAAMGFFIEQGNEQAIVFFLFVSRIEIYDGRTHRLLANLFEEPVSYAGPGFHLNPKYRENFYKTLVMYLNQGLSIKVDPTYVPQAGIIGNAQFCFDPRWFDNTVPQPVDVAHLRFKCTDVNLPGTAGKPSFSFTDQNGNLVVLHTRSVLAAYRFLGELLRLRENPVDLAQAQAQLPDLFTSDPGTDFLHITHDGNHCWIDVGYEGSDWCISPEAIGTKRVFALLHQLFELYAVPSKEPVRADTVALS